ERAAPGPVVPARAADVHGPRTRGAHRVSVSPWRGPRTGGPRSGRDAAGRRREALLTARAGRRREAGQLELDASAARRRGARTHGAAVSVGDRLHDREP